MTIPENTIALGKEVAIASIDKELHRLWEQDDARTNASLTNLAVYSEHPGGLEKNTQIIQSITREHACRSILIGMDRESPETSITAWITAHCHLAHGRKSVCCEQLSFHLTGRATGRLRNTVFAHLNSDLPLVFWWQGELSDIFSDRLYTLINRFIFDSAEWEKPAEGFAKVATASRASRSFFAFDLAWMRSHSWRLSLAALFDDPLALASLPKTKELNITAHRNQRTTALFVLAWITQQAGWKRSLELDIAADGDVFHFETQEGSEVVAKVSYDETSPLSEVELIAPNCKVRLHRNPDSEYLHQEICAGDHCIGQRAPAGADDPAQLLTDQLALGTKNTLYSKILPSMLELLG